jgi:hypothetical protein
MEEKNEIKRKDEYWGWNEKYIWVLLNPRFVNIKKSMSKYILFCLNSLLVLFIVHWH